MTLACIYQLNHHQLNHPLNSPRVRERRMGNLGQIIPANIQPLHPDIILKHIRPDHLQPVAPQAQIQQTPQRSKTTSVQLSNPVILQIELLHPCQSIETAVLDSRKCVKAQVELA